MERPVHGDSEREEERERVCVCVCVCVCACVCVEQASFSNGGGVGGEVQRRIEPSAHSYADVPLLAPPCALHPRTAALPPKARTKPPEGELEEASPSHAAEEPSAPIPE